MIGTLDEDDELEWARSGLTYSVATSSYEPEETTPAVRNLFNSRNSCYGRIK
jgi:hypothetical protein